MSRNKKPPYNTPQAVSYLPLAFSSKNKQIKTLYPLWFNNLFVWVGSFQTTKYTFSSVLSVVQNRVVWGGISLDNKRSFSIFVR